MGEKLNKIMDNISTQTIHDFLDSLVKKGILKMWYLDGQNPKQYRIIFN